MLEFEYIEHELSNVGYVKYSIYISILRYFAT